MFLNVHYIDDNILMIILKVIKLQVLFARCDIKVQKRENLMKFASVVPKSKSFLLTISKIKEDSQYFIQLRHIDLK